MRRAAEQTGTRNIVDENGNYVTIGAVESAGFDVMLDEDEPRAKKAKAKR